MKLLLALIIFCFGSASSFADDSPIIHIEKRDLKITIYKTDRGVVYSIFDKKGKALEQRVSDEELRVKNPKMYDFVKTAIAGTKGVLDASVSR